MYLTVSAYLTVSGFSVHPGIFSPSLSHNSLLLAVLYAEMGRNAFFEIRNLRRLSLSHICRRREKKCLRFFFLLQLLFRLLGTTWVAQLRVKKRHFDFFFAKMHFLGEIARGGEAGGEGNPRIEMFSPSAYTTLLFPPRNITSTKKINTTTQHIQMDQKAKYLSSDNQSNALSMYFIK